ncbi:MAG: DEAD/DEAH box helicase [Planctomycetota bacterium]
MTSPTEPGFRDLGLHPEVLAAIEEDLKFDAPTPIQREAIPVVADGADLIAKAETGTGKTLAFCAPILGRLDPTRTAVQAIVLCPTRELAQQVAEVAEALGNRIGIDTVLLVGGVHQSEQILKLRSGAQMVVGTPGRVLDFLGQGTLRLGWTAAAVLDEADRMLDMGFIDDVTTILKSMPADRQTLLFSATIPPRLKSLSKRFMREPQVVSTVTGMATVPEIRQCYLEVHPGDKEGFVLDMIDRYPDETCIVFCNTRKEVIELDRCLWGLGYDAGSLHGDHEQDQRFRVLEAFKKRQITTLVATDVAARGLDITEVARVVNYDVPDEVETYVHRIGRTGRAGGVGESITLVTRQDRVEWDRIQRTTGFEIEELTDWEPSRPRRKVESEDKRRRATDERRKQHATRASERREKEDERRRERSGGRRSSGPGGRSPRGRSSSEGSSGGSDSRSGRGAGSRAHSRSDDRDDRRDSRQRTETAGRSRRSRDDADANRDRAESRDEQRDGDNTERQSSRKKSSRRRGGRGGRGKSGGGNKSEQRRDPVENREDDIPAPWPAPIEDSPRDIGTDREKPLEPSRREGGRSRSRGGRGRGRGGNKGGNTGGGNKGGGRDRGNERDRNSERDDEAAPRRKRRRRRRKPSGGGGGGNDQSNQNDHQDKDRQDRDRGDRARTHDQRGDDSRSAGDRGEDRNSRRRDDSESREALGVNPYAAGLSRDARPARDDDKPRRPRRRRR